MPSLDTRATKLAEAGDWAGLHALLSEDVDVVLASSALSYRYGEALYHTGRMRELRAFAGRYEAAARDGSDLAATLRALNLAGIAAFELGDISDARDRWDRLFEMADGAGDPDMLARAANNLGAVANLRGEGTSAITYYRLAIPAYQRIGQVRGLAQTYHNLGVSLRDLGRLDEAVDAFDRATRTAEAIGYDPVVVMTLVSRAELEIRRGAPAIAARLGERAVALSRGIGDPIGEGNAHRVLGAARIASGDPRGVAALERALSIARDTGNALLAAETLRDLGSAGGDAGRSRLEEAREIFASLGATAETARIDAMLEDGRSPDA